MKKQTKKNASAIAQADQQFASRFLDQEIVRLRLVIPGLERQLRNDLKEHRESVAEEAENKVQFDEIIKLLGIAKQPQVRRQLKEMASGVQPDKWYTKDTEEYVKRSQKELDKTKKRLAELVARSGRR